LQGTNVTKIKQHIRQGIVFIYIKITPQTHYDIKYIALKLIMALSMNIQN